ncbi:MULTISPECIES: hypothetical protein [Bacillus]|nr:MULTISPECIES: hypothetical protein [Bacillus]
MKEQSLKSKSISALNKRTAGHSINELRVQEAANLYNASKEIAQQNNNL